MKKYGSDQTQKVEREPESQQGLSRTASRADETQEMERDELGMVARGEDD